MKSACVIGSVNLDEILRVDRMPLAGENLYAEGVERKCGGKGENAAIALSRLGVLTSFFGCVGDDANGRTLIANLESFGVDTSRMGIKDCPTGVAYIILESNSDNRIIVSPGANEAMTRGDIRARADMIEQAELVLIQLEITPDCISEIAAVCREKGKRLIVDAGPVRGIRAERLAGAYCVSPNESELEALAGRPLGSREAIEQAARELLELDIENVLVKLGSKGCLFVSREECFGMDAYPVKAVDTTAAGDSFMAGYCAALLDGKGTREAVEYASKCGAVAVTRLGASTSLPSREDVEHFENFLIR